VGFAKSGRHFIRDSSGKRGSEWRNAVAQAGGIEMRGAPLLDGALELRLEFVVPRPKAHVGARGLKPSAPAWPTTRPDVLKLARGVEDALTGIVWRDDSQIVVEHLVKSYGEPARVEVSVYRLR
jgi:Holliday junction resolvase RusA-like endonuclease